MSIPSTSSETSPSPQPDQAHSHLASQAQQSAAAPTSAPAQAPKRSSRRANTAERRATHNAVERARRETLNGRFLDLAAMLPNLAAVRRPSKSAIVNSSIALIHNQSRARIIAAREMRLLNAEANALRQELNEWRARNALPRVEEPIRSADFATLMAVEDIEMGEEMIVSGRRSFDDGTGLGDDDDYGDDGEDGAELISPETAHHPSFVGLRPPMQYQQQQQQQQQQQAQQAQLAAQQQQQQQQQQLFEQQKVAMARAQQAQFAQAQAQAQQARYAPAVHHQHSQSQPVNLFTDNMFPTDLYPGGNAPTWSQKAIAANSSLATPPGSAHGHKQSPYATTANSAFLAGHGNMGMFKPGYSASEDDQSDGSSHYSGVDHNNGAAIDQTFSFGLSSNYGMNLGMQVPQVNMNLYPGMQMPPSPPHTGSPTGSNPQSRRPSVNIPAQHGLGLVGHGGSNKSSPSPVPMSAQQYGMGLMI